MNRPHLEPVKCPLPERTGELYLGRRATDRPEPAYFNQPIPHWAKIITFNPEETNAS